MACIVLGAASAPDARADGGAIPAPAPPGPYTPYIERGNALPAPFAYVAPVVTMTARPGRPTVLDVGVGGGLGLTPHVWLDGSLGTLKMLPAPGYHSFQIGPNALLVDLPAFELAATLHVSFPAEDGRTVEQVEPGLFAVVRVAHTLRLDTGLYIDANPGPLLTFGLKVPFNVAFQLTSHVFAAVNTGVTINNFDDTPGTTAIPVGLTLGWGDRLGRGPHPPGVGLLPSISFPELIKPGARETFQPGYVAVGLTFFAVSRLW